MAKNIRDGADVASDVADDDAKRGRAADAKERAGANNGHEPALNVHGSMQQPVERLFHRRHRQGRRA